MRLGAIGGAVQLALAQALVGGNMVILKSLIPIFPLFLLYGIRYIVSMVLFFALLYYGHSFTQVKGDLRFTKSTLILLVIQAICFGFLFNILMLVGVKYTSATHVGLIAALIPLIIALLAWFFLRETLSLQKMLGLFIAVMGLISLSFKNAAQAASMMMWLGDLFVFFAIIPEAAFTIIAKYQSKDVKLLPMSFMINLCNALLFLPFALWEAKHVAWPAVNLQTWLLVAGYTLSAGVLFFLLWYNGLRKTQASTAALFTTFMPVSTVILATVFLGEQLALGDLFALLCILGAVLLGSYPSSREAQANH